MIEFAAGMQGAHDQLQSGNPLGGMHFHWDAAAVILDATAAVPMKNNLDFRTVPGQGLIDTVVNHLVNKVMQPFFRGIADVHGRPHPDPFKAGKNLDLIRSVIVLFFSQSIGPLQGFSEKNKSLLHNIRQIYYFFSLCNHCSHYSE
jgi:hypothetical protein